MHADDDDDDDDGWGDQPELDCTLSTEVKQIWKRIDMSTQKDRIGTDVE